MAHRGVSPIPFLPVHSRHPFWRPRLHSFPMNSCLYVCKISDPLTPQIFGRNEANGGAAKKALAIGSQESLELCWLVAGYLVLLTAAQGMERHAILRPIKYLLMR